LIVLGKLGLRLNLRMEILLSWWRNHNESLCYSL
jgi:hypothetical protein